MNEEEKFLIEMLEDCQDTYIEDVKVTKLQYTTKEAKVILDLINRQQKEIEELKEDYQILKDDIEGHRIVYVDTPEFEENYISKDKIEEKMRGEINKSWRNTEQRKCQLYAYDILKELLGE